MATDPVAAMNSSTEESRVSRGPAILSYGFRPFFLLAAFWAALSMALWILMLAGRVNLPTAFDPITWHAHEFLFGYLGAVVAGFLLTAVPNWTGRKPIAGWSLGVLVILWIAGRVAVTISLNAHWVVVLGFDLAMPLALMIIIAREIVASHNWRNLMVLAMFGVFVLGNVLFHWETARGGFAAQGYGLRIGLAAALMMVALIGGRIVPAFTRNWLVQHRPGRFPVPPMQRLDKTALLLLLAALLLWAAFPFSLVSALALALAGVLHLVRLARWAGDRTAAEPLLWVLHLGYLFLPVGALGMAFEILSPGVLGIAAAQHLWMAGTIGLMTLAVMTRATLGHTGRNLTAGAGTSALYGAILIAVVARLSAGIWTQQAGGLNTLSGIAWICAFAGYAAFYGPLLLRAKAPT